MQGHSGKIPCDQRGGSWRDEATRMAATTEAMGERHGTASSSEPPDNSPADTLISDFCPSELWENPSLLF